MLRRCSRLTIWAGAGRRFFVAGRVGRRVGCGLVVVWGGGHGGASSSDGWRSGWRAGGPDGWAGELVGRNV